MAKKQLVDDLELSEVDSLGGFIETPINKPAKQKTGIARDTVTPTLTKKEKALKMSKDQFKKAKADHKIAIAKLKAQRKALKADIKKHKLLIKQAKIVYKLTKMKEEK